MSDTYVSIGQVKRDISELVNRVAYGGERIVLTSRGRPKAALVSIEDYERLVLDGAHLSQARWQAWLAQSEKLSADILKRRNGELLDVSALWEQAQADQEAHDGELLGR